MATLPNYNLTYADWAKMTTPDGDWLSPTNILAQSNEVMMDAVHKESNQPFSHLYSQVTGLPEIYFRSINQGIPDSKWTTAQINEGLAIMETRSSIDINLANAGGKRDRLRAEASKIFLEAMAQKWATTLFYGNASTTPNTFTGLAPRYSSTAAGNGQNVILAGGSTANVQSSVFLVGWGDQTIYCPFAMGQPMGLKSKDLGEQPVRRTESGVEVTLQMYQEWFQWITGLAVEDWRYAGRIANIESSHFTALTSTQAPTVFSNLIHKMIELHSKMPVGKEVNFAWYCNSRIHSGLTRLAYEKSVNVLDVQNGVTQFGKPTKYTTFMGIPIRRCDALVNTEAVIA